MEPTIEVGETVRFNRFSEDGSVNIERYSLVLYRNTDTRFPDVIAIARVVGLPGEHIEIVENTITIDGERLRLPDQLDEIYSDIEIRAAFFETEYERIGPDEFFVIGDNHDSVVDSRITGPIPFSSVKGYARSEFSRKIQEVEEDANDGTF